jgi:hypothetical protein
MEKAEGSIPATIEQRTIYVQDEKYDVAAIYLNQIWYSIKSDNISAVMAQNKNAEWESDNNVDKRLLKKIGDKITELQL